jgi:thioredoxin 1
MYCMEATATLSFKEILQSKTPVLIDFFATWCGPCKMMPPILDEVKHELKDDVRILKIDVDKNRELSTKWNIQSIPTLVLLKEGKIIWRQAGVVPANELISILQRYQ